MTWKIASSAMIGIDPGIEDERAVKPSSSNRFGMTEKNMVIKEAAFSARFMHATPEEIAYLGAIAPQAMTVWVAGQRRRLLQRTESASQ